MNCLYSLRMPSLLEFFKKLKCYKVLRFLSFEFVSYFDIRISNLVAAKGRAVFSVAKKDFQVKIKKDNDYSYPFKRIAGFGLGMVFFFIMLIMPAPEGMSPLAQKTAAVTLLMVCWWISEALPIFVTALVPLALFPTLGIMNGREVAMPYAEDAVFLFLGGFCIAISMQKWNLHRRIAISIIKIIGNKPIGLLPIIFII